MRTGIRGRTPDNSVFVPMAVYVKFRLNVAVFDVAEITSLKNGDEPQ